MRTDVVAGQEVRSSDGHALGRIVRSDDDSLVIEAGRFFLLEYLVRADQVAEVRGGEVWLSVPSVQLLESASRREGRVRTEEEPVEPPRRPSRCEVPSDEGPIRRAITGAECVLSDPGRDPDKY